MPLVSDSGFHIRWQALSDYREEIPDLDKGFQPFVTNAVRSRVFASLCFYSKILGRISRQKFVWIATGPESTVLADLVFFSLLWLFWRDRFILTVRNVERWGGGASYQSRQDAFRKLLIQRIPRLVFESDVQRKTFLRFLPRYTGKTSSLPVFFADGMSLWSPASVDSKNSESAMTQPVRLGLLGGVDLQTRDFSTVFEALEALNPSVRGRLVVSVLGATRSESAGALLERLGSLVKVETFGRYISNKELMRGLANSNLLLAPLRTDLGYGAFKGTGALGDALIARCMVLLPSEVRVDHELEPAVIRYRSSADLAGHLEEMVDKNTRLSIGENVLHFYSKNRAFARATRDLGLR